MRTGYDRQNAMRAPCSVRRTAVMRRRVRRPGGEAQSAENGHSAPGHCLLRAEKVQWGCAPTGNSMPSWSAKKVAAALTATGARPACSSEAGRRSMARQRQRRGREGHRAVPCDVLPRSGRSPRCPRSDRRSAGAVVAAPATRHLRRARRRAVASAAGGKSGAGVAGGGDDDPGARWRGVRGRASAAGGRPSPPRGSPRGRARRWLRARAAPPDRRRARDRRRRRSGQRDT